MRYALVGQPQLIYNQRHRSLLNFSYDPEPKIDIAIITPNTLLVNLRMRDCQRC